MRAFCLLLTLPLCLVSFSKVSAQLETLPELNSGGRVLRNAKVIKVRPTGLQIFHDAGMETVPWQYLPEALVKKYRTQEAVAEATAAAGMEEQERVRAGIAAERVAMEKEAVRISELNGLDIVRVRHALGIRAWCLANPNGGQVFDEQNQPIEVTKEQRDQYLADALTVIDYRKPEVDMTAAAGLPPPPVPGGNSLSRGAQARGLGGVAPTASGRSMRDHPERRLETAARRGNLPAAATLAGVPMTTGTVMETQIDGEFEGFDQGKLFKMVNGQIYEQVEFHYRYHYAFMPRVMIMQTSGGMMMKVEPLDKMVRVQLVR